MPILFGTVFAFCMEAGCKCYGTQSTYDLTFEFFFLIQKGRFSSTQDIFVGIPVTIGNIPVRADWDRIAVAGEKTPPKTVKI